MVFENLSDLNLKKFKEGSSNSYSENDKLQAIEYLKQALESMKFRFPKDSIHIKRIKDKLKNLEF